MCALIAERPREAPRRSPGPSRLAYRLRRTWAKAWVRNCVTVYVPLTLVGLFGWYLAGQESVRAEVAARWSAMMEALAERPEFAVTELAIEGGAPDLQDEVRQTLGLAGTVSSLGLDVDGLRTRIEALGRVERATVALIPPETLRITLVERIPAALWRAPAGETLLIDAHGTPVGPVAARAERPDLPLLLGEGAERAVPEALALVAAAPELVPRLRALVRVGERRWDVVLTRGLRILLPEREPALALARVVALNYGEEILARDLAAIDMRLPGRPTLRLTDPAAARVEDLIERILKEGEET